jgi:hypothetical protein
MNWDKKNPEKARARAKAWRDANPDKVKAGRDRFHAKYPEKAREYQVKCLFGLSPEDHNKMFEDQNGCCAICTRHQSEFKKALAVDHDHATGEVRGLLCAFCNTRISMLEDEEFMKNSNVYLNRSKLKIVES